MSTHSGSHNAQPHGADSRTGDIPLLWCRVLAALPKTSAEVTYGYKTEEERPLVAHIVSELPKAEQVSLAVCVNAVRQKLLQTKLNAWRKSPIFQLCLLFRSTKQSGDRILCSHRLVGEHFGHFEIDKRNHAELSGKVRMPEGVQIQDIERISPKLRGKVRMPEAEREPILFLALAAWKAEDLESGKFPLQSIRGKALSVRRAFEMCKNEFLSDDFFANPEALKNDGDLMEILSLASMTLASLCSDEALLSGVPLSKFIAMVFAFMLEGEGSTLQKRLEVWPAAVDKFLRGNAHTPHVDMKIPAVPSAASEFPDLLFMGDSNPLRGTLKRPADAEMRDGALDKTSGATRSTLVQVECKNYKNGLSTDTLTSVIERMRVGGNVVFLFTSKLNGVWDSGDKHEKFWQKIGFNKDEGDLCVMQLKATGEQLVASWVTTLSGKVLEPRSGCNYLLVVLEVKEVVVE